MSKSNLSPRERFLVRDIQELRYDQREKDNTIHLIRRLVEDYLAQIPMTIHFREMFYQIVGEPYPDWLEIPEPDILESEWVKNNSLHRTKNQEDLDE